MMYRLLITSWILVFVHFYLIAQESWVPLNMGANQAVRGLYVDTISNLLYIEGRFMFFDGVEANGIGYWDGEIFHPMQTGQDDCLNMQCIGGIGNLIKYKDEIYGSPFYGSVSGVTANGIIRWDGTNWLQVGEGVKLFDGSKGSVGALEIMDDELYAMGFFDIAGADTSFRVAKWDGEAWHKVGFPPEVGPSDFTGLSCAAVYNDELYVGGNILRFPNGQEYQDIMKYDGEVWHEVAGGIKGGISYLQSMIVYKDELYVGGFIWKSAGNAGNGILKLAGDTWVDVGGSFDSGFGNAIVEDMLVWNDKLYVFGIFEYVGGGIRADNIAVWDGEEWSGIGDDVFDNKILTGAVYNDRLVVGGGFTEINGESFSHIAEWQCQDYIDSCIMEVTLVLDGVLPKKGITIHPNPAANQVTISFSPEFQFRHGLVKVCNILGEELFTKNVTNSSGQIMLNTSSWTPGLYFVTLKANGHYWTEKLVVSR